MDFGWDWPRASCTNQSRFLLEVEPFYLMEQSSRTSVQLLYEFCFGDNFATYWLHELP